jgi:hypothetical protein
MPTQWFLYFFCGVHDFGNNLGVHGGSSKKTVVPEPTPWDLIPMAGNLGFPFGLKPLLNPIGKHTAERIPENV